MSIPKKFFVITGAGRGIGLELSKILLDQGHSVLALSRDISSIQSIKHPKALALKVDLSIDSDFQKIERFVRERKIRIDVLIHNAGALVRKAFSKTTLSDFEKIYRVNVFAPSELTRVLTPHINREGHVIMISSMGGIQGSQKFAELSAYSSSKGALITLTEVLAESYKDEGISFNTLALGSVSTEMFSTAFPEMKASMTVKDVANFVSDFAQNGHKLFNGKIVQVAKTTP